MLFLLCMWTFECASLSLCIDLCLCMCLRVLLQYLALSILLNCIFLRIDKCSVWMCRLFHTSSTLRKMYSLICKRHFPPTYACVCMEVMWWAVPPLFTFKWKMKIKKKKKRNFFHAFFDTHPWHPWWWCQKSVRFNAITGNGESMFAVWKHTQTGPGSCFIRMWRTFASESLRTQHFRIFLFSYVNRIFNYNINRLFSRAPPGDRDKRAFMRINYIPRDVEI